VSGSLLPILSPRYFHAEKNDLVVHILSGPSGSAGKEGPYLSSKGAAAEVLIRYTQGKEQLCVPEAGTGICRKRQALSKISQMAVGD